MNIKIEDLTYTWDELKIGQVYHLACLGPGNPLYVCLDQDSQKQVICLVNHGLQIGLANSEFKLIGKLKVNA